ncbi:MAG: phosphohydrolase [Methylocystis sp.]|nr:MAG: phosphohydrolase [Methylocystis sp.]
MRCLVVSDLHYALPQLDWLLNSAPNFDLVIFAGDALDVGSLVDFSAQTLVVRKYLQRIAAATRLIFCSGNHDMDCQSEAGEKIARWVEGVRSLGVACDGDAIVLDNTLYSVLPWWDGPVVRERLLAQLKADSQRRQGLRWVWIHHAPPRFSPTSWSGKQSFGDADLVDWIGRYAPDAVISGHIHQSPFVQEGSWADRIGSTWVFNSGRQYGAPPAFIAFDTIAGEALWVSAMGAQSVRLDAPLHRPIPPLRALPDWFEPQPPMAG